MRPKSPSSARSASVNAVPLLILGSARTARRRSVVRHVPSLSAHTVDISALSLCPPPGWRRCASPGAIFLLSPAAGSRRCPRLAACGSARAHSAEISAAPQGPHRLDRVRLGCGLVVPVAEHPGEAERDAAGIAAARLHAVKGDLDDQLGTDPHDPVLLGAG